MEDNNKIIPDFLKGKYTEYREYTKHYAKSFYFSSFVLPKEKRDAAYAVYAFCRYADNIIDNLDSEKERYLESEVQYLLETLDEVYRQADIGSEYISDFIYTVKKYGIPKVYFRELIEGVSSDVHKKRYDNYEELDVYCYKVASVVGLIMTKIFGYTDDRALEYAVKLGKAMQLTNILRDITDDFSMGRIYLPKDELESFGYSEEDIKNNVMDERFRAFMAFQINRAKEYYAEAEKGICMLTNDGSRSTVKMMSRIYAGILNEIENSNYDIYSRRHYVSTFSKVMMSVKMYADKRSSIKNDNRNMKSPKLSLSK